MKKILSFVLLIILFASCSSDDSVSNLTNSKVSEVIKLYNITPSSVEKISHIEVLNYNGMKIAIGQKNGNSWLAKFDTNGNEIYTKEYAFSHNGISKSYFLSSTVNSELPKTESEYNQADCNIIFAYANVDNFDFSGSNLHSNTLSDNAVFLAVDMENGNVIFKSDVVSKIRTNGYQLHNFIYKPYPSNNSFLIEELETNVKFNRFISISQKGILWERNTIDREQNNGINSYTQYLLIDYERLLFTSHDGICKIYNLRKDEIIKEFDMKELSAIGNNSGDNYQTSGLRYIMKKDIIYCEYDEIEKISKIDEVTGKEEITYKTINTFYYEIDINTYNVSDRKQKV